jgi:hypothetical protein
MRTLVTNIKIDLYICCLHFPSAGGAGPDLTVAADPGPSPGGPSPVWKYKRAQTQNPAQKKRNI